MKNRFRNFNNQYERACEILHKTLGSQSEDCYIIYKDHKIWYCREIKRIYVDDTLMSEIPVKEKLQFYRQIPDLITVAQQLTEGILDDVEDAGSELEQFLSTLEEQ